MVSIGGRVLAIVRELEGSSLNRSHTRGLKITEKNACPLL